jgi:hypothetical protein
MMDNDSMAKPFTQAQDAVEQFVGEQFIDWLLDYINHEVQSWSGVKNVISETYKQERIKKFMLQKFLDAKAVWGGGDNDPGFLSFAISNLSESNDPSAESVLFLIEQRYKEEKNGLSRDLWLKLLRGLGAKDEEIRHTEPKEPTRDYVATLSDIYSSMDWQTAMGAWVAYQKIIAFESKIIMEILKNNFNFSDADLELFRVYSEENKKFVIHPSKLLAQIVVDKENKELVMDGVRRQLKARKSYYEKVMKHLE